MKQLLLILLVGLFLTSCQKEKLNAPTGTPEEIAAKPIVYSAPYYASGDQVITCAGQWITYQGIIQYEAKTTILRNTAYLQFSAYCKDFKATTDVGPYTVTGTTSNLIAMPSVFDTAREYDIMFALKFSPKMSQTSTVSLHIRVDQAFKVRILWTEFVFACK